MKNYLLLAAGALLSAQTLFAISEPKEFENKGFIGFSPDGSIALSEIYGSLTILNTETGQQYTYSEDEEYSFGSGCCISNTRVIVGQRGGTTACYWKDGDWRILPSGRLTSIAYGISRDGKRIVGAVSPDNYDGGIDGLMLIPCYWDVKSDGTYNNPVILPYPAEDLTGRVPQYVTAISISIDGNTIAGQITDFGGMVYQPIVYSFGSDGKWEYSLPQNDLYHPKDFVMPEDPGESPDIQPTMFMTPEELASYNAAVQKYYADQDALIIPEDISFMSPEEYAEYMEALDSWDGNWDNFPNPQDYMTEEEWQAYLDAVDQYYEDINALVYPEAQDYMTEAEYAEYLKAKEKEHAWDEAWNKFLTAYNELQEIVPNFIFNNVFLSADGKTYFSTYNKESFDPMTWEFTSISYPYVIDLKTNKSKEYPDSEIQLYLSSVTDNGTMLAQKPGSFYDPATIAYICPKDAKEFEPLYDFFVREMSSVGTWIKENLTHEYTDYEIDEATGEVVEVQKEIMPTGIPVTNSDLSIVALTVEDFWDDTDIISYAYLLPCVGGASVKDITTEKAEVTAFKGGVLKFEGSFEKAVVYDLNGYTVYRIENPAGIVKTELEKGVYFLKAKTSEGKNIIRKILF